jgi:hypothetical protein
MQGVTGRFFVNGKPQKPPGRSEDRATAARLWQVSEDLVGLTSAT